MTFFLKTLLADLGVAIVIAGAIFLTNLIWFRPLEPQSLLRKGFCRSTF